MKITQHTCEGFTIESLASKLLVVMETDDLIDELPVEKRHLSKLIIICRI